eukprot:TRINITY_DN15820_c0_g1_i1.p1 TRINITY_DN15820_c0_g1~~TRINITY_DN15820_c0_g1_i1.p1  ORF type:complete len:472 (+),score=86.71 TRINITY_DN15820_c0_g1_i1:49-1464(+)
MASSDKEVKYLKEGWLTKQGHFIKSWKRRWCVLCMSGELQYYRDAPKQPGQPPQQQKGAVPIVGSTVRAISHDKSPLCFLITNTISGKDFLMFPDTELEWSEWLVLLRAAAAGVATVADAVQTSADDLVKPTAKHSLIESDEIVLRHSVTPEVGAALRAALDEDDAIELRHSVVPAGFTPATLLANKRRPPPPPGQSAASDLADDDDDDEFVDLELRHSVAVGALDAFDDDSLVDIQLRHSVVPGAFTPTMAQPAAPKLPPRPISGTSATITTTPPPPPPPPPPVARATSQVVQHTNSASAIAATSTTNPLHLRLKSLPVPAKQVQQPQQHPAAELVPRPRAESKPLPMPPVSPRAGPAADSPAPLLPSPRAAKPLPSPTAHKSGDSLEVLASPSVVTATDTKPAPPALPEKRNRARSEFLSSAGADDLGRSTEHIDHDAREDSKSRRSLQTAPVVRIEGLSRKPLPAPPK